MVKKILMVLLLILLVIFWNKSSNKVKNFIVLNIDNVKSSTQFDTIRIDFNKIELNETWDSFYVFGSGFITSEISNIINDDIHRPFLMDDMVPRGYYRFVFVKDNHVFYLEDVNRKLTGIQFYERLSSKISYSNEEAVFIVKESNYLDGSIFYNLISIKDK